MFCKKLGLALLPLLALLLTLCCAPAYGFDTAADDRTLILVNSAHRLDAAYQPDNLQDVADRAPSKKGSMLLAAPAAEAYVQMIDAYRAEHKQAIYSISGYRDYAYQKRLFLSKLNHRQQAGQSYNIAYRNTLLYTAQPGTSEHQTGLAIDLSTNAALSNNFRNTAQGKWLLANCWDYGFILRYDENKTRETAIAYEPWHYRYVGLPHSLIMRDNDWVFEEYISTLQQQGMVEFADPADDDILWQIYWTDDVAEEFEGVQSISSDNAGGYIITTKTSRIGSILTAWAREAVSADFLHTRAAA